MVVLALGGVAAGCGSGQPTVPPQLAALQSTPTPAASSSAPSTPAPPKVPTSAELQKALLTATDVPPGLSVDQKWKDSSLSADTPACQTLVDAMQETPDDAAASADIAFMVGSMEGWFLEDLSASAHSRRRPDAAHRDPGGDPGLPRDHPAGG